MEFNLIPFVVEALGTNKTIYKDIDTLYQKRKYEFYKAANEHELYNHQIVKEGSLLYEEYCKKALGILIVASQVEDEGIYQEFMKIMQKGFRWTYSYVQNRLSVSCSEYLNAFKKKFKGPNDNNGICIDSNIIIMMFLALNYQKEIIEDKVLQDVFGLLVQRMNHYSDREGTRISVDKATPEDKEKIEFIKQGILKKYGRIRDFEELLSKKLEGTRLDMFTFLFDYENLSSVSIFENIAFSEKDVDEIFYLYILAIDDESIDTEDAVKFLINHMYVKYLIKAYKQVKEMYFENNKETMFIELEGLEKKLNITTEKLFTTKKFFSEAEKIHEDLQKENERLRVEFVKEKRNREELNSLREFLFLLDQNEEYQTEEINLEKLKQYKAVVIGGHERWQQKMKERLPNFIFIHPDQHSFDIRILDGIDTVFVYANYLNHSIYFRAMNAIENRNVKIVYLNQQNEDIILKEIYRAFQ